MSDTSTPMPAPESWPDPFVPPRSPYAPPPVPKPKVDPATAARPALPPSLGVLAAAALAGLATAAMLDAGIGVNLLICAAVTAAGAGVMARRTGRQVRLWTTLWTVATLALLAVPAVSSSAWPTVLAVPAALAVSSLALHGGRRWAGVLLGLVGLWAHLTPALGWAVAALRTRRYPGRATMAVVVRTVGLSLGLLIVFGLLFGTADAQVGSLLGSLVPTVSIGDSPLQVVLFLLGTTVALAAAHTAAAPRRWDRLAVRQGPERGRLEWALPLAVLNLLFGVFVAVQLVVLVGGRDSISRRTGMTPAEYARQGFWQLLWVLVLTLLVVALAKYWAPRSTPGDQLLVKSMLGLLCSLTLVVVFSALYRMKLYVDAFGLSRLRLSVAGVELWLGVVFVLLIVGGVLSTRAWLPRAVVLSAAVALALYGLIRPDALVAEQNVARFQQTGRIDIGYLRDLSADAVPALDRLPGDQRTCALQQIGKDLADDTTPWYATSLADARARSILHDRPVFQAGDACDRIGFHSSSPYGE